MSEIRTSLDFIKFSFVPFPDSLDFRQCLKSEQKCLDFGHFFLSEIWTLENPNGTKSLDFKQKKMSEIWMFVFRFWTLLYLRHTADNLMPSTYSARLNVGVSKQNQKACCKPFRSQCYTFKCFKWNPSNEIWMFCVCPKNPKCLKSEPAENQTCFCTDFGTVWIPNIRISDIHCMQ